MGLRALILGAATAALPVGATADTYGKYETPAYTVSARYGAVEVRDYAPHLMADVTVRGEQSDALSTGFRILAGYIFGGNQTSDSIAMTSPVAQSQRIDMTSPVAQTGGDGVWTVSFMMPSAWTTDTLPVPNNAAVQFRTVDSYQAAVIVFSGRATPRALAEQAAILRDAVAQAGLQADDAVTYAFYDDPFTLPWNRRNEVALRLR